MHIAMMTAWNMDSSVSVHAEYMTKAWKDLGHKVSIFSHVADDCGEQEFTRPDDEDVIRCFGTRRTNFLDPCPIIMEDFHVFVVQDLRMLSFDSLSDIFAQIKRKAKTFHVVYENTLPREPWFYKFEWDGVAYFHKRQNFLENVYPGRAWLIPFPCFHMRTGDKYAARKKLSLPLDKNIILNICHKGYEPFLRDLKEDLKKEAILLYILPPDYHLVERNDPPPWMIIREEEMLSEDRFDDYLFASDCLILHKFKSNYQDIVSATAFQALGAGCPIFVPKSSDYFSPLKNEVFHYDDVSDLTKMLRRLFRNQEMREEILDWANGLVVMNSPEIIAKVFIDIFNKL